MTQVFYGRHIVISSMLKSLKHDNDMIKSFIAQLDLPRWYRGISQFQIHAANRLLNAIRDDMLQETAHRVREILIIIGIHPMLKEHQLKPIMQICRGSDLAFLYFLYKSFYKTASEDIYTVNEQLILSTIVHLDMVATLRELDRILPPPQPPKSANQNQTTQKKDLAHKPRRTSKRREGSAAFKKEYGANYEKFKPYFSKLVEPKLHASSFCVKEPTYQASLGDYDIWEDSNFIVPNESKRWLTGFNFTPGRRVSTKVFREQIMQAIHDPTFRPSTKAEVFEKQEPWYANLDPNYGIKSAQIVRAELNDIISTRMYKELDTNNKHILCLRHKVIKELESKQVHEKRIEARDRCLKYFDTETKRQEATKKRVLEQLEKDIQMYECECKKTLATTRKTALAYLATCECGNVDMLHDDGCRNCENIQPQTTTPPPTMEQNKDAVCAPDTSCFPDCTKKLPWPYGCTRLTGGCEGDNANRCKACPAQSTKDCSMEQNDLFDELRFAGGDDWGHQNESKDLSIKSSRDSCCSEMLSLDNKCTYSRNKMCGFQPRNFRRNFSSFCRRLAEDKTLEKLDRNKNASKSKKPKAKKVSSRPKTVTQSNVFFSGELFSRECQKKEEEPDFYFTAPTANTPYQFNYAEIFKIDDSVFKPTIKNRGINFEEDDEPLDIRKLAVNALMSGNSNTPCNKSPKTIDEAVDRSWRKIVYDKLTETIFMDNLSAKHDLASFNINPIKFKYKQDYFDPDNKELMHTMLRDALQHMSKSQKFVLASMPDSDKIPTLRDWIYKRYGKTYTRAERRHKYDITLSIFKAMQKTTLEIPINNPTNITRKVVVSYSCSDYLKKKALVYKKQFYNLLNEILMETTRVFWFCLRSFLNLTGTATNIFFSYLPSRIRDNNHFRIWIPHEFKDYKTIWQRKFYGRQKVRY